MAVPRLGAGAKIDLLAVDASERRLVVIECKESASLEATATIHAQSYADEVWAHRSELYPYFAELTRALAAIYDAPGLLELELDADVRPTTLDWWPGNPIE